MSAVSPQKILVADDDEDLLALVDFALRNAGFELLLASSGVEALDALARESISLLILDINMPELNGFQVCEKLREHSIVPVLMLSARYQEQDLVRALEVGADAYMVKPFSPRALIARVRALLRRAAPSESPNLQTGAFRLDIEGHTVYLGSGEVQLTKLETRILQILMLNVDQAVSTKKLIAEVWDTYNTANRNMLKQVVFRLRRKLSSDPSALESLKTINDGYMWVTETPTALSTAPFRITSRVL